MKVSYLNTIQNVTSINSGNNKTIKPSLNNEINTQALSVKSPCLQHLKANFLVSFGENKYPVVPYKAPDEISTTATTTISTTPQKIFNIPFYDTNADELAIVLGPDKNAIITYDDATAKPELLAHKFINNVKDGKYKREGFDPSESKTNLIIFDHLKKDEDPWNKLGDFVKEVKSHNSNSKTVVFIRDFGEFLKLVAKPSPMGSKNIKAMFNSKPFGDNVQIVGLMNKAHYNTISEGSKINPDFLLDRNFLKMFGKVELKVPSEKDTKLMLKKEPGLIKQITDKYKPMVRVSASDNAINEVVDKSARNIAGSFPGKPIQVLDYVIAAKINEVKQKNEHTPIIVTKSDVERFFEKHSEVVENLKATGAQFNQVDIPKTKFTDVGGAREAKEVIEDGILAYIKNPKEYLKEKGKAPKGVLLHGGPGTGKTLLARATAGEAGVPFFSISGSQFVEMYVGVGAARVRDLFANARNAAKASDKKTAIIFIDEIDAVGKKRGKGEGSGGSDEREQTLNQILAEMDGFNNDPKCSVIVMAATNRIDTLDDALKRPGRFDDKIEVPNPSRNIEDRLEILKICSRDKKFLNEEEKEKVLKEAATITAGLSGAELADMMTKTAKIVSKRQNDKFITSNDLVEAYLQVKAGPIIKSDKPDSSNVITVAHECGHALVAQTINDLAQQPWKKISNISFITLDARGGHLGAVYFKPNEDSHSPNFDSVVSRAAMGYAGGISESIYQDGRHDAGVSGDLGQTTELIDNAITKWGLGPNTGLLSMPENSPLREMYKSEIKDDIKIFTKTSEKIAKLITDFNKDFITEYVDEYKKYADGTKNNDGKDGKGGNTLSGEGFKTLHDEWLIRTGKDKEQPLLQKKINILIDSARDGKLLTDSELEEKLTKN